MRNIYKNNLTKFNNYIEQKRNDEKSELDFNDMRPIYCKFCDELEEDCECEDEDEFFGGWDKNER